MERTSHYGLPIFEADDHPSILTDFNQAMHDIDEAMFTISMGGSASAEAIEELRQGLASVSTQINTINQALGTKLDGSFLNNLAPQFDAEAPYNTYEFVFKDGNLYQCIGEYDPANDSFDKCFVAVWLCNNVTRNQSDIEALNGSVSRLDSEYSSLDGRVATNENNITSLDGRVTNLENNPPTPTLPIASRTTLGGVKVGGQGIGITSDGSIYTGELIKKVKDYTPSASGDIQVKVNGVNDTRTGTRVSYAVYNTCRTTEGYRFYAIIKMHFDASASGTPSVSDNDVVEVDISNITNYQYDLLQCEWVARFVPHFYPSTGYSEYWDDVVTPCRAYSRTRKLVLQFKYKDTGYSGYNFILFGDATFS